MRWFDRQTGEQVEGVTLREARRDGHLPSVTGVINDIFQSYGLARWRFKIDLECLADQMMRGEQIDMALAEYEGKMRRELIMSDHIGLHNDIGHAWECHIHGERMKRGAIDFSHICEELGKRDIDAPNLEERLVSSKLGYCGQPDAYGKDLIDWKFTTRGDGGFRDKILDHGIQLAAYADLVPGKVKRWFNVVISAKDPSLFRIIEWSEWEQAQLTETWRGAFKLWCLRNKYDPRDEQHKMRGALQVRFRDYWETLDTDQKKDLSKSVGSTSNYLSQIAHGHAKPSRRLIRLLLERCEGYTQQEAAEDLLG
jgi:hypothetical protein